MILESHKINATTSDESDKLNYTTSKYTDIPLIHRALMEDLFKKVDTCLHKQVEVEINTLAKDATTIIEGLTPIDTSTRRKSVRASVTSVLDKTLSASAATAAESATRKDKIKEQTELLKERVKQLHSIDRRVKESARRIADEYKNLQTAKDARNKLAASHSRNQDLTTEEKINDIIKIEKSDMETSIDLRNTTAIKMLGIATRVVRQRNDNKGWKSDDLKAIDKLRLWEQSETSTKGTTKALKHALANWATINIDELWALSPFIARLCESGVGGWKVPCDNITRDKTGELLTKDKSKTPAENMLIAWNKVGFSVEDPTAAEIADYQATHSKLPPEKLTDEAVTQQLMIMEMEVATGTYRDESVAAYKEMYSHLGKDLAVPVGSLATC